MITKIIAFTLAFPFLTIGSLLFIIAMCILAIGANINNLAYTEKEIKKGKDKFKEMTDEWFNNKGDN